MANHQWSNSNPKQRDVVELLEACYKHKLSTNTVDWVRRLGSYDLVARLVINLTVLLKLAQKQDIENILISGLTKAEREVLNELDSADLPIKLKETAHGLFCIHERWIASRALNKSFKEAKEAEAFDVSDVTDYEVKQ